MPTDRKASIRRRYQTRLRNLKVALEQFNMLADQRLNEGGNIRNRSETKNLLEKAEELLSIIPSDKSEEEIQKRVNKNLSEFLNIENETNNT